MSCNSPTHFYIVTPCFNAEQWIDSAIASVVTQEGSFYIHYHVQDGGSSDATVERLKYWQQLIDHKSPLIGCDGLTFSWASEPDDGMYDAINKGFEQLAVPAEGILAWVNADDCYVPHAFATAAQAFNDVPQLEWMGGSLLVARDGVLHTASNTLQPYPTELIVKYCCDATCWEHLHQASMFWTGRLWHISGGLDASLRYAGDYELWPRFAQHAPFVHMAVPLCIYRSRAGQLSLCSGYVAEKEKIVPSKVRQMYIRAFWRKRIRPPMAPALKWNGKKFDIVHCTAWPKWGSGRAYYWRRLRYMAMQAAVAIKKIFALLGRLGREKS